MSRSPALAAIIVIALSHPTPVISGNYDGAYAGASGAVGFNAPITPDYEFSGFVGYNAELGSGFVAGGELDVAFNPASLWGLNAVTGTLDGRAGFVVIDDVLVYGRAGLGYTTGSGGSTVWDAGAGIEFPLMEDVRLRGEFKRTDPFAAGLMTQYNGKVGVAFSF